MKEHDYNTFVELMKTLSLNFKGEVSIPKINLYFNKLKKYKLIAVKRGIDYLISDRIYNDFPIVGQISDAIKKSRFNLQEDEL